MGTVAKGLVQVGCHVERFFLTLKQKNLDPISSRGSHHVDYHNDRKYSEEAWVVEKKF